MKQYFAVTPLSTWIMKIFNFFLMNNYFFWIAFLFMLLEKYSLICFFLCWFYRVYFYLGCRLAWLCFFFFYTSNKAAQKSRKSYHFVFQIQTKNSKETFLLWSQNYVLNVIWLARLSTVFSLSGFCAFSFIYCSNGCGLHCKVAN